MLDFGIILEPTLRQAQCDMLSSMSDLRQTKHDILRKTSMTIFDKNIKILKDKEVVKNFATSFLLTFSDLI